MVLPQIIVDWVPKILFQTIKELREVEAPRVWESMAPSPSTNPLSMGLKVRNLQYEKNVIPSGAIFLICEHKD